MDLQWGAVGPSWLSLHESIRRGQHTAWRNETRSSWTTATSVLVSFCQLCQTAGTVMMSSVWDTILWCLGQMTSQYDDVMGPLTALQNLGDMFQEVTWPEKARDGTSITAVPHNEEMTHGHTRLDETAATWQPVRIKARLGLISINIVDSAYPHWSCSSYVCFLSLHSVVILNPPQLYCTYSINCSNCSLSLCRYCYSLSLSLYVFFSSSWLTADVGHNSGGFSH